MPDNAIDNKINELMQKLKQESVLRSDETTALSENETPIEEEILPPEIRLEITKDKMNVFLNVKVNSQQQEVSCDDILNELQDRGVVYGINRELLKEFCANRQFFKSLKVASGLMPVRGADGYVEFHFRKELSNTPVELEDGTLDFKNLQNIENVVKDDLLCTIVPPELGIDGTDVTGAAVPAQQGKAAPTPTGKNITLSEDKFSIYAAKDGAITYKNNQIVIDECKVIKGNVGLSTGNIDFGGSVIVHGDVSEGFVVKAAGDITVKGNVEGAQIISGGNVVLTGGVNGMGKGIVKSEGDVTAKYIENVTVDCGKTVRTDVALNSSVWAKEAIIVRGNKGTILSGSYIASDFIYVKYVGNENRNLANLMVQNMWYLKDQEAVKKEIFFDPRANARDINEAEKKLESINKLVESIKAPNGPFETAAEKAAALKKSIFLKSETNQTIAKLKKELEAYEKSKDRSNLKIICPGAIYAGGKITLDKYSMRVEHTIHHQKIYLENGEIVYGEILPHEKEIN